jgi:hypothetical protein
MLYSYICMDSFLSYDSAKNVIYSLFYSYTTWWWSAGTETCSVIVIIKLTDLLHLLDFNVFIILWRICSMQELLSHRGLGARAQRESCGLYRRVARRQLCERLDSTTGSANDVTYPNSSHHYTTLGKHPSTLGCDVTQQWRPYSDLC